VPIARTGEQLYGKDELEGLDANGSGYITVHRPGEEVFRDETLASFEGKPVTLNHPSDGVNPDNWKNLAVGHVQNVRRGTGIEDDLILGDLLIEDSKAIEYINENLPEISSGYSADYDQQEPGRAIQRNIVGNHVAVLMGARGRAGARVSFRDSNPTGDDVMQVRKSFWRELRDGLTKLGLKTADAEKLQENLEEHVEGDATPHKGEHVYDALDERLRAIEDRFKAQDAKDAEEKEKKEREEKEAHDRAARDASEHEREEKELEEKEKTGDTILSAESPGHVINLGKVWSGSMTGDSAGAEPVLQAVISRAEILAPGIEKPTPESLRGNKGAALAQFMRSALEKRLTMDGGREDVNAFTFGRPVSELSGHQLVSAFNGAAQLTRSRNNVRSTKGVVQRGTRTGDFSKPLTGDQINERNRKFWAERSK
jgi:hypothetical protein